MNGATDHPVARAGDTFAPAGEGELLLVPAELAAAIDAAAGASTGRWADNFVRALHDQGLILVPRGRSQTRELVGADLYAMALSGKYAVERVLLQVRQILAIVPVEGGRPLLADLERGLAAVLGHAPPADRECLVTVVEQLTALHTLLGGAPVVAAALQFPGDALVTFVGRDDPDAIKWGEGATLEDEDLGRGEAIR